MRAMMMATTMLLATAADAAPLAYPPAVRGPVVDTTAGIRVPDPYRWLEGDVRKDTAVQAWVAAQNRVTQPYLASLPRRDAIKARLTQLWNYEKTGLPDAAGDLVFYRHNTGLENQYTLMVEAPGAAPRMLIDPNGWSKDGATALAEWRQSRDGKYVAYTVQDGGTDWRTIKVLETATGHVLDETLDWAKFTDLAWDRDSKGFFYSRHPANPRGKDFTSAVYDHQIHYHRIGTPQSRDRLIFRTPDHLNYYNDASTTADGRWLVIRSSRGSDDNYAITVVDLAKPDWQPRTLIPGLTSDYRLAGAHGDLLYFVTNNGAPRYRLVSVNAAAPGPARLVTVVPEGPDLIEGATRAGERLVVARLQDARSTLVSYPLAGGTPTPMALPGIGTAVLSAETQDGRLFWAYSSFATPGTIYRYSGQGGASALYRAPKAPFDPAAYEVAQVFYKSKDGTRVPMFVARKRGQNGPAPTILYGYGGFNISLPPSFSPATVAWMEMGGVWALANIRGGGEYGTPWHAAGKLFQKQNVFDDFIAAGESLIATGVTPRTGLAILGGSNGGLLVGAVTNQRPDLFAAAIPEVGVMDMTRFHLFTEGRTWTDDYGNPEDAKALAYNLTYSPYHNVKDGRDYPAILVMTADTDDRVVPGHSFKYTAALQHAQIGDRPHIIRIETRAGHGSGKPTDKIIEETADRWAFAGYWTGLTR